MTIPADHWHDNHDGTAWWVNDAPGAANMTTLDRPCDTCGGECVVDDLDNDGAVVTCEWCGGTGRHVFDIEVGCPNREWISGDEPVCPTCHGGGKITHRVHVVPGMVLPVTSGVIASDCVDHLGNVWEYGYARDGEPEWTLVGHAPPAAEPGMTAVKLAIT